MKTTLRRLTIAAGLVVVAGGAGINLAGTDRVPAGGDADLHLVLNVAGNRLHVYENGERTRTYKVSVGTQKYQTPPGEYRIRSVIWNPWWHPPESDWARDRKPEPPGPDNPMGRVKLNFAPLLYIHGTTDWQSLGAPASHGCVRMSNRDLIELTRLVHKYASDNAPAALLDKLAASPSMTRTLRLDRTVRFTAFYEVATVKNDFLVIYPDHYGLVKDEVRQEAEAKLEEHGIPRDRIHRARLDRLVEKSATRRVAMELDSLRVGRANVGDPNGQR